MSTVLYKKDKKGNILRWMVFQRFQEFCVEYGRLGGKQQLEVTTVTEGKQNRSIREQIELQMNSLISKQKDKGYKSLDDLEYLISSHEEGDSIHTSKKEGSKSYGSLEEFLKAELPNDNTDANGRPKPMKCTALQDTKTNGLLEKVLKKIKYPCFVQPKLDGVRCIILFDKEAQRWIAISSSGKDYSVAARQILAEVEKQALAHHIILDGELYIHGEALEYISGLARKMSPIEEQLQLQFHLFDIVSGHPYKNRRQEVVWIAENYFPYSELIVRVPTNHVPDFNLVKHTFDNYTEQGYEGLIIRNSEGTYKQGVRSSEIFKWKAFQDAEFEIIGLELGKRGSEDLVFILKAHNGEEFKAKPLGNRRRKAEYVDRGSQLKGKRATVQFLTLSQQGIPQGNPRVKAVRDYE